ncbi:MAG: SDR family oxidoreductase [Proteobacteria bacterium]|nr:SDR family oxidoreductase [Pseudomonadota bacterium]
MNLQGKTALVLGSVKGIGKGIGLALAREGVKLALTYYDWEESLPGMEVDFSFANPYIQRINLLETKRIPDLIQNIVQRFGGLDILINNMERGGWPIVHGPYVEDQWDLEMATTLRAKRWVFEEALPHLKASGNGAVINLSSIAGVVGRSGPADVIFNDGYAAANRGISSLTETWARMAAPEVRVNELMLGLMETRHGKDTRGWGLLTENRKQALLDHTLLDRMGSIDDVVRAVLFILKDATFMTGTMIRLDGGYVLGGEKTGPMPKGVV